MNTGWVGVDFDGTLAENARSMSDPFEIGQPVPLMLGKVLRWLYEGKEVRIVTARVNSENNPHVEKQRIVVDRWIKKYIGQSLPITCKKSHAMIELWDDRAVQVIPNTGEPVLNLDGSLLASQPEDLHCSAHVYHASGCSDCYTKALFSSYVREEELLKIAPRIAIH